MARAELDGLVEHAEWLARSGDFGAAAAAVNLHILDIDPAHVGACTRLGRCCLERGDVESAAELFARALELDPDNRTAENHLWDVEVMRQRQRRAVVAWAPEPFDPDAGLY